MALNAPLARRRLRGLGSILGPTLRVLLLAAVVAGLVPTAGDALAQAQQPAPFPRSAAFLPSPVGAYVAVNLAPDAGQRGVLDRLFNYYMTDPDLAVAWQQMMDQAVPGMSGDQLRAGLASWVGNEAFVALPSPADTATFMQSLAPPSSYSFGDDEALPARPSPADVPFLAGVAVRDPGALIAFIASMGSAGGSSGGSEGGSSADMSTTVHNGITVMTVSSASGMSYNVAMPAGFMIFSSNLQTVYDALDRAPATSLAASAGFREVLGTSQQAPLAVVYSDSPGTAAASMPGFPGIQNNYTAWDGATLRIDAQGFRVDQVSATNTAQVTPAMRALMSAPANPYQGVRLVPANSSVLLAFQHMDLVWAAIKEVVASSPDMSDEIGQASIYFRAGTGLDLDRDVFGWMAGEIVGFVAPGGPEAPGGFGGGLLVQAADPAMAQAKATMVVDALRNSDSSGDLLVEPVTLGGAPFSRMSSGDESFVLYVGAVGPWVVATDDATVATGIVQRAASSTDLGLAGDPSFTALRSGAPGPSQNTFYVDITALTGAIAAAAGAPPADTVQMAFVTAPLKRLFLSGASTAERSRTTAILQIAVP